jgi:hypothetical protein
MYFGTKIRADPKSKYRYNSNTIHVLAAQNLLYAVTGHSILMQDLYTVHAFLNNPLMFNGCSLLQYTAIAHRYGKLKLYQLVCLYMGKEEKEALHVFTLGTTVHFFTYGLNVDNMSLGK